MKVFLLLIFIVQGAEPKMKQVEMPDLDHCLAVVQAFLLKEPDIVDKPTVVQAGCSIVRENGSPA